MALQLDRNPGVVGEILGDTLFPKPKDCGYEKAANSRYLGGVFIELPLAECNKTHARHHREKYGQDGESQIAIVADVLRDLGILVPQAFLRPLLPLFAHSAPLSLKLPHARARGSSC